MQTRTQNIEQLERAVRAIDGAVETVLADAELTMAGGLERLVPFRRALRFALAEAEVTTSVAAHRSIERVFEP